MDAHNPPLKQRAAFKRRWRDAGVKHDDVFYCVVDFAYAARGCVDWLTTPLPFVNCPGGLDYNARPAGNGARCMACFVRMTMHIIRGFGEYSCPKNVTQERRFASCGTASR